MSEEKKDEKTEEKTIPYARFKEANDRAKKAEEAIAKLQTEQEKSKEGELKEQNKFKELAEQKEKEVETLKKQMEEAEVKNVFIAEISKAGVVDANDAYALADKQAIAESEDSITGVQKAIEQLKQNKDYLFKPNQEIGSAPQPSEDGTAKTKEGETIYYHEDIKNDKDLYNDNKEDIMLAYKDGRVLDKKPIN